MCQRSYLFSNVLTDKSFVPRKKWAYKRFFIDCCTCHQNWEKLDWEFFAAGIVRKVSFLSHHDDAFFYTHKIYWFWKERLDFYDFCVSCFNCFILALKKDYLIFTEVFIASFPIKNTTFALTLIQRCLDVSNVVTTSFCHIWFLVKKTNFSVLFGPGSFKICCYFRLLSQCAHEVILMLLRRRLNVTDIVNTSKQRHVCVFTRFNSGLNTIIMYQNLCEKIVVMLKIS